MKHYWRTAVGLPERARTGRHNVECHEDWLVEVVTVRSSRIERYKYFTVTVVDSLGQCVIFKLHPFHVRLEPWPTQPDLPYLTIRRAFRQAQGGRPTNTAMDDDDHSIGDESSVGFETDPIFDDFMHSPTLETLRRHAIRIPHYAKQNDGQNWLLLHSAMWFGAPVEVTRDLVGQWPPAVRHRANLGVPLHYVSCRTPLESVKFLVEQWPEGLQERSTLEPEDTGDGGGCLPLVLAIYDDASLEVIAYLAEQYPDSVRHKTFGGWLPAHVAASRRKLDVTRYIVQRFPEALQEVTDRDGAVVFRGMARANQGGHLPLHVALRRRATVELVQCLVGRCPHLICQRDAMGRTPLHLAVLCGAPVDVVRYLAGQCPASMQQRDDGGCLPLHLNGTDGHHYDEETMLEVGQFLLEQWPASIREKSTDGFLPLHLAAKGSMSYSYVHFLVRTWPKSARQKSNDGFLPLHCAAERGNNFDIIRLLVDRYPDAIRQATKDGLLPLHAHAHAHGSDALQVFRFFVLLWPESVGAATNDGRLPLHCAAAQQHAMDDGLRYLIERMPSSVRSTTREGWLPVHYAARYADEDVVLRLLFEQWPDSFMARTAATGALPLHLALASGQYWMMDAVRLLVEQRPGSVRVADNDGALPLHAAVSHKLLKPATYLVEKWPESVHVRDRAGSLPLHRAVARPDASFRIVNLLVEKCPDSLQAKDATGLQAFHVAAANDAPLSVIFYLLVKWPECVSQK